MKKLLIFIFLLSSLLCMTTFADIQHNDKNKTQNISLFISYNRLIICDEGIFFNSKNSTLPISALSFDKTSKKYLGIVDDLRSDGLCPGGHPYYPELGGCIDLACHYYWGNSLD